MNLGDILHPIGVADFLLEYFGSAPLYVPSGDAKRFAGLAVGAALATLRRNMEYALETPLNAQPNPDWPGCELHRNERDRFVLQVSGRHEWSLFGKSSQPQSTPTWQAEIVEGGMFYLPKGWWCSAACRDAGYSLDLLVENPTGADLLRWLAGQLAEDEALAVDIPRFADPATKADYLIAMRRVLAGALRLPGLLERYARYRNDDLQVRENSVPLDAVPMSESLSGDHLIQIATPRPPRLRVADADSLRMRLRGEEIFLPMAMAGVIQYVIDKAPVRLADLLRDFAGEFDAVALSDSLSQLVARGVITFAEPRA